jgi:hypothetical protein
MSYTSRQTANKAVPERSQTERGAACPETLKRSGGVQVGDPSGPEIGTRGTTEVQKTADGHVWRRSGGRPMPLRPGQHA